MSQSFTYPSLMYPSVIIPTNSKTNVNTSSLDVAVLQDNEEDGYNNAGLEIYNEFVGVANRELINRELVNLENANVNIDNSSDVIIGPVTQFNVNGNVTIYQGKDGQPVGIDENTEIPNGSCEGCVAKTTLKIYELYIKFCPNAGKFLLKLFMSTILTTCALFLYLGVVSMNAIQQNYYISYNDSKIGNYSVYYINQWGKVDGNPKKNPLPIGLVIIGDTRTKACNNFQDCSKILKSYLEYEITSLGYENVCENFFIADDGTIYVGGGWDIRNCYDRLSIEISFIGDFNHNNMTRDMIDSFLLLLDQGVTQYKLPRDYIIVAMNQTTDTFSPGKNVYDVIKQMCHFSNMNLKPKLWKDFFFSFIFYSNNFFRNILSGKNNCMKSASL